MSIPKLKVYRLENGYSETADDDMQFQSKDELLPIETKKIDLYQNLPEAMVGVTERCDARVVKELDSGETGRYYTVDLYLDKEENAAIQTVEYPCDGWVLGHGNFKLFVWVQAKNAESGAWTEIPERYWDYVVSEKKMYRKTVSDVSTLATDRIPYWIDGIRYRNTGETDTMYGHDQYAGYESDVVVDFETAVAGATEVHQISMIVFKIGEMLTMSTSQSAVFEGGYSNYMNFFAQDVNAADDNGQINHIKVMYKKYAEASSIPSQSALEVGVGEDESVLEYRVPFGSVYNGNRDGRCLHWNDSGAPASGPSLPADRTLDNSKMNYYEGNYLYRRRVFPLRCLVGAAASEPHDAVLEDGTCEFTASHDWYADGMMKPVAMELLQVDPNGSDARYIFKPLAEGTQITKVYKYGVPQYRISFNSNYYKTGGGETAYPPAIYLFYNYVEDSLGDIFDFSYDYSGGEGLGYTNNLGLILANTLKPAGIFSGMYMRHEFLAVRDGYGYDASKGDVPLAYSNGSVEFTVPGSFLINGVTCHLASSMEIKFYANGEYVGEYSDGSLISATDSGGQPIYQLSPTVDPIDGSIEFLIGLVSGNAFTPNDLMVSCMVEDTPQSLSGLLADSDPNTHEINAANGHIVGYRVPCYEKTKTASTFVSSFPNWVKGHLNNDLDVFIGYREYSGMNATTQTTITGSILPNYVKDGWHPMYPEGSLQFSEPVTQFDYLDVFNFGTQSGAVVIPSDKESTVTTAFDTSIKPNYMAYGTDLNQFRLYCTIVFYNVAHYESIYTAERARMSNISVQNGKSTYAFLEDDGFESAVGRRWLLRQDNYIRLMYTAGQDEIPKVTRSQEKEPASVVDVSGETAEASGMMAVSTNLSFIRVNTGDDRVTMLSYVFDRTNPSALQGLVVCLNRSLNSHSLLSNPASDLTQDDARIHVKIAGNVFKVGAETNAQEMPSVSYTVADIFDETNTPVTWTEMPAMPDLMEGKELSFVQSEYNDQEHPGNLLKRFKYSNPEWDYDVFFEVFSYRYNTDRNAYTGADTPIESVEFLVYREMK